VRAAIARFWPYARPYRWWFALSLALIAAGPALDATTIWLFKLLVDDVLVPRDVGALPAIALAYLAITLVDGALTFGARYVSSATSQRFVVDLRVQVFAHLQRLSLDFFERRPLGDLLARLSGDISAIETLVLSGVSDALKYAFEIVFFAGALFFLDARLALLALSISPLFWFAARRSSSRLKRATREQRRRSGASLAVAEETLANEVLVQAYGRESSATARFAAEAHAALAAYLDAARTRALFAPIVDLLELAGVVVVVGVGTYALAEGSLSLGGLLVFLTYLDRLYRPIRGITGLVNVAFTASAGAERVGELLDEAPMIAGGTRRLSRAQGKLDLADVSFRYPGTAAPALQHVSLSVDPGEVVALVGASGAGKSTLVKLVLRFLEPDAGHLRVDGIDLADLDVASLRRNIGVVLQETLLFDASIAENIAYGLSGATEAQILDAGRRAGVDGFARVLLDGYATRVGQRGRRLSGGQRQRIALARALIRDPAFVILDEPTTGLDGETTSALLESVRTLARDRTVLVISHSLLCVRDATRIVVLDGGRLVEVGTHATLLTRDGTYARIFGAALRADVVA
jgi:ABC-type multidrug transport system fused ATPase/permease subunit